VLRERQPNDRGFGSADEVAAAAISASRSKDAVVRHLHHLLIEEMGTEIGVDGSKDSDLRPKIERRLARAAR
jgi:hypothetical protein